MMLLALMMCAATGAKANAQTDSLLAQAGRYTSLVSKCNEEDRYKEAISYADSAIVAFNKAYRLMVPNGSDTLVLQSSKSVLQSEIFWYHDRLPVDFNAIRTMRNDVAVAALALHEWAVYRYNNKVYTQLYKEMSADSTLEEYCRTMQKSKANKYMAIVILIILSLLIFMAYFLLYYRHQVNYRFCLDRVKAMNDVLRGEADDERKLSEIERLAGGGRNVGGKERKPTAYDDERLPQQLQAIADELITTLQESIEVRHRRLADIDLAEDEVKRCEFENDKLHVCNSVLDNCLSTLKHETMYYPSRIRMLIDKRDEQLQSVSELADYYKELYSILSLQAMRQMESVPPECVPVKIGQLLPAMAHHQLAEVAILGDRQMLRYLFGLLAKQGGGASPDMVVSESGNRYVTFRLSYPKMKLTDEECHELFNPSLGNLPFLLCRQIVRDIGDATNARGCGIRAENNQEGITELVVTLVKARNMAA